MIGAMKRSPIRRRRALAALFAAALPPARRAPGRRANTPISRRASSRTSRCAATACSRWRRARTSCSTPRRLSLGPGARFQRQSVRRRRHRRQALPHSARTARANCWPNSTALEIHAIAIDSKDRVYAATSPDGKVYRIAGNGQAGSLLRPQGQVHLGAGLRPQGQPYVATGDQGEIHRVTPDGKGKVFFKTDETHVRSMAFDADGQPDRGHRSRRPGAARFARRAKASCCTRCPSRK